MPPKKFALNQEHGYIGDTKSKPIVRDFTDTNEYFKAYWLLRDRLIYKTADKETKQQILKRYDVDTTAPKK